MIRTLRSAGTLLLALIFVRFTNRHPHALFLIFVFMLIVLVASLLPHVFK
jgi:hypothetical protein